MSATIMEFDGVDAARFERIRADFKGKAGIDIDADKGQASAKGITVAWEYDRDKKTLTVNTVQRSWYDPSEAVINQKIRMEIENTA